MATNFLSLINPLTAHDVVELFCKELNIPKVWGAIINEETLEVRFYKSKKSLYKAPKNWNKFRIIKFRLGRYPDLLYCKNFYLLLNIHWFLFGSLGDVYKRTGQECFEENYLKMRLAAIKMSSSLGGGNMLQEYKNIIQKTSFDYNFFINAQED